jgi:hypothetical protein
MSERSSTERANGRAERPRRGRVDSKPYRSQRRAERGDRLVKNGFDSPVIVRSVE